MDTNTNAYINTNTVNRYHSLFSCFDDLEACLAGICCPVCINTTMSYRLATNHEPNCCGLLNPPVITPYYNRKSINRRYDIENKDYEDCLVSYFCAPCVIIQNELNYNELQPNDELLNTKI